MTRPTVLLASLALAAAVGVAAFGQPTLQDRLEQRAQQLDAILASRAIHLDPAEVNALLHDPQVRIQVFDVRDEAAFNVFHLRDADNVRMRSLEHPRRHSTFDDKALKVFVADREARAERAWRLVTAAGVENAYVLAGGIDLWLAVFRDGQRNAKRPLPAREPLDGFAAALGGRHPSSFPDPELAKGRRFEAKAKRLTKASKPAGGCG